MVSDYTTQALADLERRRRINDRVWGWYVIVQSALVGSLITLVILALAGAIT